MVFTDDSLGNGKYKWWDWEHWSIYSLAGWRNRAMLSTSLACQQDKRVVRSTIAAEALSLQEGLEAVFFYRTMVEEILGIPNKTIPITAYTDNKSVIEAVFSTKLVDEKRLRVDIAAIREFLKTNDIRQIKWCAGDSQLANCMKNKKHLDINCWRYYNVERWLMNFPMIDITRQLYANINDHYTIYLTYSNFIYFNFLF